MTELDKAFNQLKQLQKQQRQNFAKAIKDVPAEKQKILQDAFSLAQTSKADVQTIIDMIKKAS